MRKARYGPSGATAPARLAANIADLRALRNDASLPAVRAYEPKLGRELLEAAYQGRLMEVADALSKISDLRHSGEIYNRGQFNVLTAYSEAEEANGRQAPTIGEIRSQLRKRLPDNEIPDDRTVRDILERFDLPLKPSRRGPSRKIRI